MISYILVSHVIQTKPVFSNYNKDSKLQRDKRSFEFYRMFNVGIRNIKIELIGNFPCIDAYNLRCKQTEIINKMLKDMQINKNKYYIYIRKKIKKL
jgi:hypothetical protein